MTLIERFKLDHPDNNGFSEEDVEECMLGCPRAYGYTTESFKFCKEMNYDRSKYSSVCVACWNREIPETPKAEPELKFEEELTIKKEEKPVKKNFREALRDRIRDLITPETVEEMLVEKISEYDFDYAIERAYDDVFENIDMLDDAAREIAGEYIGEIASEIMDI